MADDVLLGFDDLIKKMDQLEAQTATKVVRSAMMSATLPTVRGMEAAAPKGTDTHRTYKGRLVAPGFVSRNIKRKAKIYRNTGTVSLRIGVAAEAYYGVTFMDEGVTVTQRNGKSIKPYKITGKRWFKKRFEQDEPKIIELFRKRLAARIKKVTQ